MLVEQIMHTDLVTVTPATVLAEALRLTRQRGIRHLLVVEAGALVGIISDRDLKRAIASDGRLDRVTAAEVMTRDVLTASPNFTVEEAARIMVREKISALPVALSGRLLGIVTETDVLVLFVRALGAGEPSSRLDVMLGPERSGLAGVVHSVESTGTPISSIMTLAGPDRTREVVIRVPTINPGPAIRALEASGFTVKDSWRG